MQIAPEAVDPVTDLVNRPRHVAIFTTASLPWMTGTAVNPLMRAVYLAKPGVHDVTLVVPFLTDLEDQARLFPKGLTFDKPEQQEKWVRNWLRVCAAGQRIGAQGVVPDLLSGDPQDTLTRSRSTPDIFGNFRKFSNISNFRIF